jgi:hypothetical protein
MAAPTRSGLHHLKIPVADLERNATILNVPGNPVPLELRWAPIAASPLVVLADPDGSFICLMVAAQKELPPTRCRPVTKTPRAPGEPGSHAPPPSPLPRKILQRKDATVSELRLAIIVGSTVLREPLADAKVNRLESWARAMKTPRQPAN